MMKDFCEPSKKLQELFDGSDKGYLLKSQANLVLRDINIDSLFGYNELIEKGATLYEFLLNVRKIPRNEDAMIFTFRFVEEVKTTVIPAYFKPKKVVAYFVGTEIGLQELFKANPAHN